MNVRLHRPLRIPMPAALGLCGLALATGCSVAPAGATANSAAIGPVRTGHAAKNFAAFPVPATWNGQGDMPYRTVVKSKAGSAPRKFGFTARQSMVFWLNCIGAGSARLASPAIGLAWGIPCGNGADPVGITFTPPLAAHGKPVKVLVTASAGSRWEVRVDESATAAS